MHRLSGEDTGFLAMDLPGQPMNTMAVGMLEHRPAPVTLAEVRAHLVARLPQLPSFRWRVVGVPLRLHHPVCVDDPDFDLDFHLRTETVDAPGADTELDRLFATIAERHLDRRHPLWQTTLVDGLAGGRQALILKYHHCLADGVAAYTTFSRIFSDDEFDPLPGVGPFDPQPLPGRGRLLADAVADHARSLRSLPRLAVTTRRRLRAVAERRRQAPVSVPGFSGEAPRTVLNDAFTPARSYTRAALPLAQLKAVKDAAGVTLNDVVLAVVAGAARRYLAEHGDVPARPLLASVPVSSEPADAPTRQAGNRFWSFTTSLATDETDPLVRLDAISATSREARRQLELLGTELMPAWLDRVPPLVAEPGARALVERLRAATDLVDVNILISNIRGPVRPWRLFDTEVEDLYVDGPPSNGVGCNVMVWSYGERVLIGVLAFADALAHPESFSAAILDAFTELEDAVLTPAPTP